MRNMTGLAALGCMLSLALVSCSTEETSAANNTETTPEAEEMLDKAAEELDAAADKAADAIDEADADAELEKLKKELDSDG
jgi:phosphotransacetylase